MRNIVFITLIFSTGLLISCKKDDPAPTFIYYDGDNQTAPIFRPGTNSVAVWYDEVGLEPYVGDQIVKIHFFTYDIPETATVRIFSGDNPISGSKIYESVITPDQVRGWNEHTVTDRISIPEDDLWVTIEFNHSTLAQLIGCDSGPMILDNSWINEEGVDSWSVFSVNVNWNIKVELN